MMPLPRRVLLAPVVAIAAACSDRELPRRPQVLLYIDTDAPLAPAPGEAASIDTPTPLFDRLRIDVITPDGEPAVCASSCTEDFSVDRGLLSRGELSLGILPKEGGGGGTTPLLVRARLFRGARARGDVPATRATIERIVTLPSPAVGELAEVTLFLPLDSVGTPADIASPEAPITGRVVNAKVHDGVTPHACTTPPGDGQLCVRGGAFWWGDPLLGIEGTGSDRLDRVAALSSFWLDRKEATVAEMRASGVSLAQVGRSRNGSAAKCTMTDAAGPNEALPVTCVPWETAVKFCEARGSRLPTDAELEFATGGRASNGKPWGRDKPQCEDTVLARADPGELGFFEAVGTQCSKLGVGPSVAGSGRRDSLLVEGGEIVDLLGNVTEWVADESGSGLAEKDPCRAPTIFFNPLCKHDPPNSIRVSKGVHFAFPLEGRATQVFAFQGSKSPAGAALEQVGVRCARDGIVR